MDIPLYIIIADKWQAENVWDWSREDCNFSRMKNLQ